MASRAASLLLTVPVLIAMVGCGSKGNLPLRSEEKFQEQLIEISKLKDVDKLQKIVDNETEDKRVRKAAEKQLAEIVAESKQDSWGAIFYAKTQRLLDLLTESSVPEPSHTSHFFSVNSGWLDLRGDARSIAGNHFYYPGGLHEENTARQTSEFNRDRWYYGYQRTRAGELSEYMAGLPNNNEVFKKVILDARQKKLIEAYSKRPKEVMDAMDAVNRVLQDTSNIQKYIPIDRHGKPFYTEKELVSQLKGYSSSYKKIHDYLENDLLPAIKK